jgi:phage terminase small subunit
MAQTEPGQRLVLFGFSEAQSNAWGFSKMARTRSLLGEVAESVMVELSRDEVNRLRTLAKGLGWSPKKRQVSVNTVFLYGLDAAEELLEERKQGRTGS